MSWAYGRKRPAWRSLADALVFLCALALVIMTLRSVNRETLAPGQARVIDGDSLHLGDDDIRLYAIDAPEYRQECRDAQDRDWPCGEEAAEALRGLVAGQAVTCTRLESDRYGRTIAKCRAANRDVNAEMVRRGWAIAYRRHGLDYVGAEDEARRDRRGIWQGSFENPERWRSRHRALQAID